MLLGLCTEQSTGEWDVTTIDRAAISVCVLTVEAIAYTISAINKAALQTDLSEEWLSELEGTIRTQYNQPLEGLQKQITSKYAGTEHEEKARYLKDFVEATIIKMGTIPLLLRG